MAAAVYARISSDQDGTRLGVDRQLEDCRRLAQRQGWRVAEEYVDNDFSAYSRKPRPAYQRMLDDLRNGLRDGLLVYHVDRLTRRPIELEEFLAVIDAARVRHVRFVAGDTNLETGDGTMVLRIMAAVAANESETKSRRVKRKMEQNAALGLPHGGFRRPFGYDDDKITVLAEEAAVIRSLVARFLAGESLRSLASWLDAEGVRTVSGTPWRTTTLKGMLTNPRYAGLRAHNHEVIGPACWEAIISEEDHRRVLAHAAARGDSRRRTPRRYLLSGLLRCGRCGGRLFSSPRAASRRYVCLSGPDHGGCGRLTIVADPLERFVADAVMLRLDTPGLADALAGRAAQDVWTAALAEQLSSDKALLVERRLS